MLLRAARSPHCAIEIDLTWFRLRCLCFVFSVTQFFVRGMNVIHIIIVDARLLNSFIYYLLLFMNMLNAHAVAQYISSIV